MRLPPWDFPSKNTGMGCHFLLQGMFLNDPLNGKRDPNEKSCLLNFSAAARPELKAVDAKD